MMLKRLFVWQAQWKCVVFEFVSKKVAGMGRLKSVCKDACCVAGPIQDASPSTRSDNYNYNYNYNYTADTTTTKNPVHHTTVHHTTLHYTTLNYITVRYTTLNYIQ